MASLTDTAVDRVRKHRQKLRQGGGAHIGLVLKPGDDATVWNRLVFEKGGPTPALRYLLALYQGQSQQEVSDEILLATLAARLRRSEAAGSEAQAPVAAARKEAAATLRGARAKGEDVRKKAADTLRIAQKKARELKPARKAKPAPSDQGQK